MPDADDVTPLVLAPADLVVATSDGVDVRFAGLDLDVACPPTGSPPDDGRAVRLRLEGVRTEETMRRDAAFDAARSAWADVLRADGRDAAGPAPTMPGVPVLHAVQAVLTDDVGTAYRWVAGQVAGDGTEWEAVWFHAPRPPRTAHRLRLAFTLDGVPTGRECEVRLR